MAQPARRADRSTPARKQQALSPLRVIGAVGVAIASLIVLARLTSTGREAPLNPLRDRRGQTALAAIQVIGRALAPPSSKALKAAS